MFFIKPHYSICQTFNNNLEMSDKLQQVLKEIKSRLEELDFNAVIITVIK